MKNQRSDSKDKQDQQYQHSIPNNTSPLSARPQKSYAAGAPNSKSNWPKGSKAGLSTHSPKSDDSDQPKATHTSSSSSDHTDRDGIVWGSTEARREVREVKNIHDSVIHQVVSQDDPVKLRELLSKGIKGTTKSIDGATPLHRAAELGTIRCAEVLLKYCKNINIDAENCQGQTPFHIAGINKLLEFGRFLKSKGAKSSCRKACTKCRWLNQMLIRLKKRETAAEINSIPQLPDEPNIDQVKDQAQLKAEKNRERRNRKKANAQIQESPILDDEEDDLQAKVAEEDFALAMKQFKKELSGPYLNREDNVKLRHQQKQNRNLHEQQQRELSKTGGRGIRDIKQHIQTNSYPKMVDQFQVQKLTKAAMMPLAAPMQLQMNKKYAQANGLEEEKEYDNEKTSNESSESPYF